MFYNKVMSFNATYEGNQYYLITKIRKNVNYAAVVVVVISLGTTAVVIVVILKKSLPRFESDL